MFFRHRMTCLAIVAVVVVVVVVVVFVALHPSGALDAKIEE